MRQLDMMYIIDNQLYNAHRKELSEYIAEWVDVAPQHLNMDGTMPDRVIHACIRKLVGERVFDADELQREIAKNTGVVIPVERLMTIKVKKKAPR